MSEPRRRVILHVDMDAFFVAVELRRRPELVGLPVVVGGDGRRGVIAAASYEARRYGVHSALPSSVAKRRCPHMIFLPGDHTLYGSVSKQVHAIFHRYTPLVEPLALDEAFLDVSGSSKLFGDGATIAQRIRADISGELELAASVGVAPNKFLAKLASVSAKPRAFPDRIEPGPGVMEVPPGRELEFLHPLPVRRLWGVGPKTLEKLDRIGVRTIGDLAALDERTVTTALGATSARHLMELAMGRDNRDVEPEREAKSIGHEETFEFDVYEQAVLRSEMVRLADAVAARLRRQQLGARTFTLKVRFDGFRTVTRSTTLGSSVNTAPEIVAALDPLLAALDVSVGVRLLGVSSSNFGEAASQMSLLDDGDVASGLAAGAIDQIRERYGSAAISPASAVRRVRQTNEVRSKSIEELS
ncbi:MAG TPA: DNA polymerase IV [Ilumatobacter sp.]|nr:DNA polymerase IV [Ilumatobacter sp.]